MNPTLRTSYRMLYKAFKRALFETFNTLRQKIRAKSYISHSERKRYNREAFENQLKQIYWEK